MVTTRPAAGSPSEPAAALSASPTAANAASMIATRSASTRCMTLEIPRLLARAAATRVSVSPTRWARRAGVEQGLAGSRDGRFGVARRRDRRAARPVAAHRRPVGGRAGSAPGHTSATRRRGRAGPAPGHPPPGRSRWLWPRRPAWWPAPSGRPARRPAAPDRRRTPLRWLRRPGGAPGPGGPGSARRTRRARPGRERSCSAHRTR